MAVKPHGLANRPGEPYPATFRKSVDPPRIELGSPPRQGGVVPLDHEPISCSGPAGESNPDLLGANEASSRWTSRPCSVRGPSGDRTQSSAIPKRRAATAPTDQLKAVIPDGI